MTVLGIDPAVNRLGYGVLHDAGGRVQCVCSGFVAPPRTLTFPEKLRYIYGKVDEVVEQHTPDVIAVEEIYVGRNIQIALKIGQVMGLVMGIGLRRNIPFVLIPPSSVKKSVVGTGSAGKEQVQYMVNLLTGASGKRTLDESDALAVALACIFSKGKNDLLH